MEEPTAPPEQPKKTNTVLYIVIGAVVLCCVCCGLALLAQWLLQNSDFSLVNAIRPILYPVRSQIALSHF